MKNRWGDSARFWTAAALCRFFTATLAQSKTLARTAMAFVNAKRLGVRWPATAFPQRRVSSTSFRKQNRNMICGRAFTAQVVIYLAALIGL
jgi:hypothetical protein